MVVDSDPTDCAIIFAKTSFHYPMSRRRGEGRGNWKESEVWEREKNIGRTIRKQKERYWIRDKLKKIGIQQMTVRNKIRDTESREIYSKTLQINLNDEIIVQTQKKNSLVS